MSDKYNSVKNRFLPMPESAVKGLEHEPKITDFEILKELGSGSFGKVYLVKHKETKAEYAIKAIDKNKKRIVEEENFRRIVEDIYKINHPNIIKLFGHFEDNHYCYFIMEYFSKGNVDNLIRTDKKKRLSTKTKIYASIIKDVICAVYFLHNMKPLIIVGDIKPENVLLSEGSEGLVTKLTDLSCKHYIIEESYTRKNIAACSTRIYLAPELLQGKEEDEAADIWMIGILLFELVTGYYPFQGDLTTTIDNILKLKITWPKDINTDAKTLIMKILKLDPKQRLH
jgi:aurora kinase